MKLHKSLTRVTPLSKTIALILFIAFPFIGFYLGMQYQQALDIVKLLPNRVVSISSPSMPKKVDASLLDFFIAYQIPKGWNKTIDQKTGAIILRSSEVAHAAKEITGMEISLSRNGVAPTSAPKQPGIASPLSIQTITIGSGKGFISYSDNPQPMYTVTTNHGTDAWKFTFTYSKNLESTAGTIRDTFLSSIKFTQPKGL